MARKIEIEDMITVGDLAERLTLPATKLIGELMKNGVMATINERIDFDTADIIVSDLGLDIELVKKQVEEVVIERKKNTSGEERPPVVAVMGHVDHGKTSLLDAIRGGKVAASEAGGITQHISAYQIDHEGKKITFLDTPGHEAFAAIREHGAALTDVVVLVVAADDGVKPQTMEAIRFARKAGVKIIVAINKIDKPSANSNQVKQQLSEHELLAEDWGGDTVMVEVSAKEGTNIPKLLEMILLLAQVEELKAEQDVPATGLIIEAKQEQGKGPMAVALVDEGILRKGDFVVAGAAYGKVRTLESSSGSNIQEAGPSTPVRISGFKSLPSFGDAFVVAENEKAARTAAAEAEAAGAAGSGLDMNSSELIRMMNRNRDVVELNIIIKADVQGSLTSVTDSLKSLDTDEVAIRLVASGIGAVSENDINLAQTTGSIIYGFNTTQSASTKNNAARDHVPIRLYSVIYELIDDVKAEMEKLLSPQVVEEEKGRLVVKGIFKIGKDEVICGGEVTKGTLVAPAMARVLRGDKQLAEVRVTNLKRGPQDVKEVPTGEMCGINLATDSRVAVEEGDRIEVFTRDTVARSLS